MAKEELVPQPRVLDDANLDNLLIVLPTGQQVAVVVVGHDSRTRLMGDV